MHLFKARYLVVWAFVCVLSLKVSADTIPQDLLDLDFQRCNKDCVVGFGAEACEHLCKCTVNEFKNRLDFSAYLDLSVQLSKNSVSDDNRTLLDTIANYCASELDKAGIEVGAQTEQ